MKRVLIALGLVTLVAACGADGDHQEGALGVVGTYRTRLEDVYEAILTRDREKFERWLAASQPTRDLTEQEFEQEAKKAAAFRHEASEQVVVIDRDGTFRWTTSEGEGRKTTVTGTWKVSGSELTVSATHFRSGESGPEEAFEKPRRGVLHHEDGILSQTGLPCPLHRDEP